MTTKTQTTSLQPDGSSTSHDGPTREITETRTGDNSEVASATVETAAGGDLEKAEGQEQRKYKPGEKWKVGEVHVVPHKYVFNTSERIYRRSPMSLLTQQYVACISWVCCGFTRLRTTRLTIGFPLLPSD